VRLRSALRMESGQNVEGFVYSPRGSGGLDEDGRSIDERAASEFLEQMSSDRLCSHHNNDLTDVERALIWDKAEILDDVTNKRGLLVCDRQIPRQDHRSRVDIMFEKSVLGRCVDAGDLAQAGPAEPRGLFKSRDLVDLWIEDRTALKSGDSWVKEEPDLRGV
jgi:hypothetical protein